LTGAVAPPEWSRFEPRFYWPIVIFWCAVATNHTRPVLLSVVFDFAPLRAGDYALIDYEGPLVRDELAFYTLRGNDYVGRLIGVPGDQLLFDPLGHAVFRDDQPVVRVPPGYELTPQTSGSVPLRENEYAIYVHDPPKNPFSTVVTREMIYGPLERYLRRAELTRGDWLWIGSATLWMTTLLILPLQDYVATRPRSWTRTIVFALHAFVTVTIIGVLGILAVASEVFGAGVTPAWWIVPIMVLRSTGTGVLACVCAFVALQWIFLEVRERRAGA
jgi:hypothetical protein